VLGRIIAFVILSASIAVVPAQAQRRTQLPPQPPATTTTTPTDSPLVLYERCMELAQQSPAQAYPQAFQWRMSGGGGFAAEHCEAVALFNLQQYEEAAKRFHEVAEGTTSESVSLRTEAYDQAAHAWLLAQKPERARTEYDSALKLAPKDVNLLIGRAQAEGTAHDYWAAIDDLNAALDVDGKRADALVLRAAAYRHVDSSDAVGLALDDVTRAIGINPNFADAYLERGTLRAMKNDYDGARQDWKKAEELAPDTYVSQQAKANTAQLDKLATPTAQPASSGGPPAAAPPHR
jgi:tetratricopeptide (TPR) repeat protein